MSDRTVINDDAMPTYPVEVEQMMTWLFRWLSEKNRRRYAAVEAAKFVQGGIEYIARVLGCDPKTIQQGREALEPPPSSSSPSLPQDDPAADGHLPDVGAELSQGAGGPHRRRPDAREGPVGRPDAAGDFPAASPARDAGGQARGAATAQGARVGETQGPQDEGDENCNLNLGRRHIRLPFLGNEGHKTLGNWYTTLLNAHGNPIEHCGDLD